jgi:subtilisin family serine protease
MITPSLAAALLALACSDRLPTRALLPESQALQSGDSVPQLRMTIQPRTIHLNMATINVVLFSSADFDAASVDADSVRLHVGPQTEGVDPVQRHGRAITSVRDYDGDGRLDRMISFRTADLVAAGLGGCAVTLTLQGHGSRRFVATDPSPPRILGGAEPQSLRIEPDTLSLRVHRTGQLSARATGANGEQMLCDAQWSSADSTIASVDPQGEVRGRLVGQTQITAQVQGLSAEGSVEVITAGIVPIPAPDYTPPWVYRDLSHYDHLGISRKAIGVYFQRGASQAQRQAAIDRIGGEVVGGWRGEIGDGMYLVRIDASSTADVLDILSRIKAMPGVRAATVYTRPEAMEFYLRPNDSGEYQRDQWQLTPDRAGNHFNWGLNAIGAPFAWGCETGASHPTSVAVIDRGFRAVNDLKNNIQYTDRYDVIHPDSPDHWRSYHGLAVSGIIGAVGNNGEGMTGVSWRARLRQYDAVLVDDQGIVQRDMELWPITSLDQIGRGVVHAGLHGSRVINISMGLPWGSVSPHPDSLEHHARVMRWAQVLYDALDALEEHGVRPLIVLSAGNIAEPAYWSGFPAAKELGNGKFKDRIIVVANAWSSISNVGTAFILHPTSSTGSLVDLAAPGEGTGALNRHNRVRSFGGTSAAAPHVSGAAALLFSFDHSLRPEKVKEYLLDGAAKGGRTAGPYKLLNVHESLKLAAERPGAPLCGNRIWGFDGVVTVQRGAGSTVVEENIITTGGTITQVNPMHGGKQVRVQVRPAFGSAQIHTYNFHNGSWVHAGSDHVWAPPGSSGTMFSFDGTSHDGNQWFVISGESESIDTYTYRLDLYTANGTDPWIKTALPPKSVPQDAPPFQNYCYREFVRVIQGPHSSWGSEEWQRIRNSWNGDCILGSVARPSYRIPVPSNNSSAFSPLDDRILLVVNYEKGSITYTGSSGDTDKAYVGWAPINSDSVIYEVRVHRYRRTREHDGAQVFAFTFADSAWTELPALSRPNPLQIHGTAISEDGREWVTQIQRTILHDGGTNVSECWTEYQDLTTGGLLHRLPWCTHFRRIMIAPNVIGGADPVQPSRGSRSANSRQAHGHSGWRAVSEPHQ